MNQVSCLYAQFVHISPCLSNVNRDSLLSLWVQDRPSTKVHAAPGGGSSLDYLFGGGGGSK